MLLLAWDLWQTCGPPSVIMSRRNKAHDITDNCAMQCTTSEHPTPAPQHGCTALIAQHSSTPAALATLNGLQHPSCTHNTKWTAANSGQAGWLHCMQHDSGQAGWLQHDSGQAGWLQHDLGQAGWLQCDSGQAGWLHCLHRVFSVLPAVWFLSTACKSQNREGRRQQQQQQPTTSLPAAAVAHIISSLPPPPLTNTTPGIVAPLLPPNMFTGTTSAVPPNRFIRYHISSPP